MSTDDNDDVEESVRPGPDDLSEEQVKEWAQEAAVDYVANELDGSDLPVSRRQVLGALGATAVVGGATGGAAGATSSSTTNAMSIASVTPNTYRIAADLYGGPASARSELVSELGSNNAGAKYRAEDTGGWYHWDGSSWGLMDGEFGSVNTEIANIGPDARPWGDRIDVFTIGGQSNAEGRGSSTGSPTINTPTGYVYDPATDSISLANDPVGDASDGSAWPWFARRYYERTGVPVVFIETANGGSAMHKDAENGNGHWDDGGSLRVDAKDDTLACLTYLDSQGYDARYRGLLWSQGERDAQAIDSATITKTDYENAFIEFKNYWGGFVDDWTDDWSIYVFVTGQPSTGDTAGFQAVREVQWSRIIKGGKFDLAFGQAATFADRSHMVDTLHYDQNGLNEMGRISAERVAESGSALDYAMSRTRAYLGSAFTADATDTTIPFDSTAGDRFKQLESDGSLRVEVPGEYELRATVTFDMAASGTNVGAFLLHDGTKIDAYQQQISRADFQTIKLHSTDLMAAGDSLEVQAFADNGNGPLQTGQQWTHVELVPLNTRYSQVVAAF